MRSLHCADQLTGLSRTVLEVSRRIARLGRWRLLHRVHAWYIGYDGNYLGKVTSCRRGWMHHVLQSNMRSASITANGEQDNL